MSKIPTVSKFMTQQVHTVGIDQSLAKASKLMTELGIRHLPVLSQRQLVGVISERDVLMLSSMKGIDPEVVAVEEALTADPYIVSPEAPLPDVCLHMAECKLGCVIICQDHKLVGILSWVDALKALNALLPKELKPKAVVPWTCPAGYSSP